MGTNLKHKEVIVSLTGGLGNQLFQLAIALNVSNGGRIFLETEIGNPRRNTNGEPELFSYKLPPTVQIYRGKRVGNFLRKASGFLLRIGVSPKSLESNSLVFSTFNFAWNLICWLHFKRYIRAQSGRGVGFFEFQTQRSHNFLYGYFQSYRWAEKSSVKNELLNLRQIDESTAFVDLCKKAKLENPLFVHIRLGDYKSEENIGTLSKTYYEEAINLQLKLHPYNKIWIFSDEPELAIDFLPEEHRDLYFVVPDIVNSATETLELMRNGKGYVIGNSTFSWWGAFLSHNYQVPVMAPTPWFQKGDSPIDIIPPNWIQLPRY
jgi:Glycosyl transferase family 11